MEYTGTRIKKKTLSPLQRMNLYGTSGYGKESPV
jgi:hypothetical protein